MPSRLSSFEKDLARAWTLPAFAYTDPNVLAEERTRIFRRAWQPVGHAADVREPGTFFTAEVADAPIVVTRDLHGELRGFYNVCRHRAGPVAVGKGARKSLMCRYHGWTYDLDGSLRTTPELGEPVGFDRACMGLRPVRVATCGPLVLASLDEREPLSPSYAAIAKERSLEGWRFLGRKDWFIACNWKVYVDNFLEGYHVPVVHPYLMKTLDYDRYVVETHEDFVVQHAPLRDGSGEGRYYFVFPNVMFNFYGGRLEVDTIVPLAPDKTLTIFEWFVPPDITEEAEARARRSMQESDSIQEEDIAICEAVQKNLASGGYDRGRFSTLRENGVHFFQALVSTWLAR